MACNPRHAGYQMLVLTLEAFSLRVACPSVRTVTNWTVLLGAAQGIAATWVLHQARVYTDVIDTSLRRRALVIKTTCRLLVIFECGVKKVGCYLNIVGNAFDPLSVGCVL